MGRFLMFLSYLGTHYNGIQKQVVAGKVRKDVKTIATALEIAIKQLRPLNIDALRVVPSSRTDTGVHAFSTPVHVDIQHSCPGKEYYPDFLTLIINKQLCSHKEVIRVVETFRVEDDFHCRRGVISRHYVYRLAVVPRLLKFLYPISPLELNRSYTVDEPFNISAVQSAARLMSGTHNFTAFSSITSILKEQKNPIKSMSIGIRRAKVFTVESCHETHLEQPQIWEFHFWSKAFLYKQIRRMMGCLVAVGKGKITQTHIQSMLDDPLAEKCRHPNGLALPGHALSLVDVVYDPFLFDRVKRRQEKLAQSNNIPQMLSLSQPVANEDEDVLDTLQKHYTNLLKELKSTSSKNI